MAKTDNLQDFLADIANAIRAKKGTTALINPQDFAEEIESLSSSSSSSTPVVKSDVNFYDYDGTLLHSYSKSEFLALQELPNLPTQPGLICQEWNYSLTDAQEYVTNYGVLDIGATYITDDDKTRLYIRIAAPGRMNVPLYFSQTVSGGVTIDWGDGSDTKTLSGTGNVRTTHTYAEIGDYCISLSVKSGILGLGHMSPDYCVMGGTDTTGKVYNNMLQKVYIGKGITSIDTYAFGYCQSLSSIVIPSSVTSIGIYAFRTCYPLSFIVIPSSVTSIGDYAFHNCYSLASVVIPSSVTSIGNYAFQYCHSLSFIVIPSSVTSIGKYFFNYCYSLASVVIPSSVTSIGKSAFYYNQSLASIVIPSSVTSIGNSAFGCCYGMRFYDFSSVREIPTLSSTTDFSPISDCKIVVPDDLYDSWKEATYWSTYASAIVKSSEFNG